MELEKSSDPTKMSRTIGFALIFTLSPHDQKFFANTPHVFIS